MPNPPLISCLMVTLPVPERFDGLKESVAGYVGQTYQPRELVVVANGGTPEALAAIKAHIASLDRDDIRILEPPGTLTLGALRNISKASARGEVVCQWDDDDLYHPERLKQQLAALVESGAEAVCLQHVMQYFRDDRRLYCTNFRDNVETVFAGSLMCWARTPVAYPETGERARLGEDTEVACQLLARGGLRVLADRPHLYIYVCHGDNSWDEAHHRNLANWRGQSQGLLRRREATLREGLSVFDFGPGGVTVQGSNGPAFTIGETTQATPAPISLSSEPLISCLMVTLPVPERLGLLKQAIAGYLDQTYARRELVVVIDGRVDDPTTPAIRSHLAALGRDDIRIVDAPAGLALGALRNLSKASALGEVVCQWDDDDLHHPERLERQLAALVQCGGEAVGLQHVMQFFPGERALYCINWLATTETIMPSSLMCHASAPIVYPETGARARLGEDTEVALQLLARGGLHPLADAPHLYVYVFHGHNASGEAHHRDVADWHSQSRGLLRRREAVLREGLSAFDFGPGEVTVQGSNGPAFVLGPGARPDG